MRFWDSSAIVSLLLREKSSNDVWDLLSSDEIMVTSFITPVEITSALWRRLRDREISVAERDAADEQFAHISGGWIEIDDLRATIEAALRVLSRHHLKTADALQLASAIAATDNRATLPFVTLDKRLAAAAAAEGFPVLPPPSA